MACCCLISGKIGGALARLRIGFLRLLQRAKAYICHFLIAHAIEIGQIQRCATRGNARLRLGNERLLRRELCLKVADLGSSGLHFGARLIQRGNEVSVVNARQNLAGSHLLVVCDHNRRYIARHPGRDNRRIGLHIRITC